MTSCQELTKRPKTVRFDQLRHCHSKKWLHVRCNEGSMYETALHAYLQRLETPYLGRHGNIFRPLHCRCFSYSSEHCYFHGNWVGKNTNSVPSLLRYAPRSLTSPAFWAPGTSLLIIAGGVAYNNWVLLLPMQLQTAESYHGSISFIDASWWW